MPRSCLHNCHATVQVTLPMVGPQLLITKAQLRSCSNQQSAGRAASSPAHLCLVLCSTPLAVSVQQHAAVGMACPHTPGICLAEDAGDRLALGLAQTPTRANAQHSRSQHSRQDRAQQQLCWHDTTSQQSAAHATRRVLLAPSSLPMAWLTGPPGATSKTIAGPAVSILLNLLPPPPSSSCPVSPCQPARSPCACCCSR